MITSPILKKDSLANLGKPEVIALLREITSRRMNPQRGRKYERVLHRLIRDNDFAKEVEICAAISPNHYTAMSLLYGGMPLGEITYTTQRSVTLSEARQRFGINRSKIDSIRRDVLNHTKRRHAEIARLSNPSTFSNAARASREIAESRFGLELPAKEYANKLHVVKTAKESRTILGKVFDFFEAHLSTLGT